MIHDGSRYREGRRKIRDEQKRKLVIIGNGMAPGRMLEHLFESRPDRYEVTIFNAEPRVNYDRIMLSPVLSGEKGYEQIIIHGRLVHQERHQMRFKGHKVTRIDRAAKTVTPSGVTSVRQARHRHRLGAVHHPPVPGKTCRAC